jgi:HlyD family secretion protein
MKYKKWSLEEKLEILSSSEELGIVEACRKYKVSTIPNSSNENEILNLKKAIKKNRLESSETNLTILKNVENSKLLLLKSISEWERKYLLKAPMSGIVSFHNFLITEKSNIEEKEEIFSVVPVKTGKIFGVIELPILRSGKVKKGQSVNIYLDNYPYEEFGMIKGLVSQISTTANNNLFLTKIELPKNLKHPTIKKLNIGQL